MRRFVVGLGVLGMGWVAGCLDLQTTSGTDCTAGQVQDLDPVDCKQKLCNNGVFVEKADDAEVPDDVNPCTVDGCMDGAPRHDALADGEVCAFGGNAGICVAGKCEIPCISDAECDDVNPCTTDACGASMKCAFTPDDAAKPDDEGNPCTDEVCSGGVGTHPSSPKDTPCGMMALCDGMGSCVAGCNADADCPADTGCADNYCDTGTKTCQATQQPPGTACPSGDNPSGMGKCDVGGACLGCMQPVDCPADWSCDLATNKCDSCKDAVKNGSETDVDCGGGCIDACMTGKACAVTSDCVGECDSGVCVDCFDGSKNGTEGDVDCGGICMAKCSTNQSCNVGSDCVQGVCTANKCAAPTCMDGVKNGAETDVDCGGSCPNCGPGKKCVGNMDCVNNCVNGTCN